MMSGEKKKNPYPEGTWAAFYWRLTNPDGDIIGRGRTPAKATDLTDRSHIQGMRQAPALAPVVGTDPLGRGVLPAESNRGFWERQGINPNNVAGYDPMASTNRIAAERKREEDLKKMYGPGGYYDMTADQPAAGRYPGGANPYQYLQDIFNKNRIPLDQQKQNPDGTKGDNGGGGGGTGWMKYAGNQRRYGLSDLNDEKAASQGMNQLNEYGQPLGTLAPYRVGGKNIGKGGKYKKANELYRYGYRGFGASQVKKQARSAAAQPTDPANPYPIAIDYGTMGEGLTGGETFNPQDLSQFAGMGTTQIGNILSEQNGGVSMQEAWRRRNRARGKFSAAQQMLRDKKRRAAKGNPVNITKSQNISSATAPSNVQPQGNAGGFANNIVNWNW